MTLSETRSSFREPAGLFRRGAPLLIAAVLVALPLFWFGLTSLVSAWSMPEYSHGPIIPLISAFLFLREMRKVPPAAGPVRDRWPGVVVVLFALTLGVLGNLVRIPDIVTYAMIAWAAGLILVCFGFRRGILFWPAVIHLFFMLPLPQFVYWQISTYLQTISSQLGVGVLQVVGIPVFLDGNIIDLGIYKLQVAEACSGLRYLFPMLSFTYVFAVLYQGPRWHKALLLITAAPLTVAMNSFRIGMIGVLVNSYGIEHAEGFLHAFEGWVIFLTCVGIMFLFAIALQRLTPNPKPIGEALDIEFEGLGAQARRIVAVPFTAPLAAVVVLTATVSLGWAPAFDRSSVVVERQPFVIFPNRIEDWRTSSIQTLDPEVERVLAADDYFTGQFENGGESAPVDLFMAYYFKQTEGGGIHSPEVCIPAGGWEVSDWTSTTLEFENGETVPVNRAIIQKGLSRQVVYYWFEQRGRRLTNDYMAKAVTVWDSLTLGRTDGALIRAISPIGPGESEADADARLRDFIGGLLGEIDRFVPA